MVREPIEEGPGQPLRAEHGRPLVEGQVAGDQDRAALVAAAEDLEQQFRSGGRQRHVAELVDDQQLVGGQLLLQAQELPLVPGFQKLMDQGCGGGEADGEAPLTGCQPEPESDVGLAGAAWPKRDHVLPLLEVGAAGELQDQHLVQGRDGGEVEAVQALDRREAGRADAPLDHPPLAFQELELGKTQQVGGMVDTLRRALPGELVVLAQEGRQLERLEVVRQQELGRVAHAAAPPSRAM
jgi:hypothetical protein